MKELLVVVDMQADFVTGPLGTPEAEKLLPALLALLEGARERGAECVFTQDTHEADYLTTQEGMLLPVPHCIHNTAGWELLPGLRREGERVFEKPTFGSVALAQYAEQGGYDRVILCGVCTDICVVSNALLLKAFCPEAEICVAAGACAGTSPAAHDAALATMRSCQVVVL